MPVKTFAPNPWGLYDAHGNVWEWCRDWYGELWELGTEPVTDPEGPIDGKGRPRVVRGGCWDYAPESCRSAYRFSIEPNVRTAAIGFRPILVRLPPTSPRSDS